MRYYESTPLENSIKLALMNRELMDQPPMWRAVLMGIGWIFGYGYAIHRAVVFLIGGGVIVGFVSFLSERDPFMYAVHSALRPGILWRRQPLKAWGARLCNWMKRPRPEEAPHQRVWKRYAASIAAPAFALMLRPGGLGQLRDDWVSSLMIVYNLLGSLVIAIGVLFLSGFRLPML
jgi:hypothetical protein